MIQATNIFVQSFILSEEDVYEIFDKLFHILLSMHLGKHDLENSDSC